MNKSYEELSKAAREIGDHQFIATPVGGEIIVTALNDSDVETINQI